MKPSLMLNLEWAFPSLSQLDINNLYWHRFADKAAKVWESSWVWLHHSRRNQEQFETGGKAAFLQLLPLCFHYTGIWLSREEQQKMVFDIQQYTEKCIISIDVYVSIQAIRHKSDRYPNQIVISNFQRAVKVACWTALQIKVLEGRF